jgi:hypothetical protein
MDDPDMDQEEFASTHPNKESGIEIETRGPVEENLPNLCGIARTPAILSQSAPVSDPILLNRKTNRKQDEHY